GNDLAFDIEKAKSKVNEELANNFGNLISRAVKLSAQTFDGTTPPPTSTMESTKVLAKSAIRVGIDVYERINRLDVEGAVGAVVELLNLTNKYFGDHAPWSLVKEGKTREAGEVLYSALESVRIASVLLSPVMPKTTERILRIVCPDLDQPKMSDALQWGLVKGGTPLDKNLKPVFARL
ncbi:hypothetical protein EBR25_14545, partial [bacterium]|nr:hypothetical protein [bacterium]